MFEFSHKINILLQARKNYFNLNLHDYLTYTVRILV